MPISRCVDKKTVVHLHDGILHGHKKKELLPLETARMDLEIIILNDKSQSEKENYHMVSLTCGI